jgi:hypothetical protein
MKNSLKGINELDRMRVLMGQKTSSPSESTKYTVLKEITGPNNKVYGVIKENSYYHIMENSNDTYSYTGGLANKNDYRYNSYSEALKQMNLMISSLNETHDSRDGINLFEEKRYIINAQKQEVVPPAQSEPTPPAVKPQMPKPQMGKQPVNNQPTKPTHLPASSFNKPGGSKPAPVGGDMNTAPDMSVATPPMREPGVGVDFDAEVSSIERELGGGQETPEKEIQSLTGKLGQALRQGEESNLVDTELTKYVVNSVFSALNLAELTDEDKLDIIKKVKNAGTGEEEFGSPDMPDMGGMPPEEEDDTEMEIDGLKTGMDDELDIDMDDFEDEMTEDMLYGDGEDGGGQDDGLTSSLRSFVQKTVDSYIDNRG